MWAYLLIAFVLLPVYIPAAVFALERDGRERARIAPFVVIGAGVALILLLAMIRGPIGATLAPYHVNYWVGGGVGPAITLLYIVAVCGALLLSGHRILIAFGVANLVVLPVLALLDADGFASLWCAYAALVAGVVALYMRRGRRRAGARSLAV